MPYLIEVLDKFKKEAKRLRKKYPSLDNDLEIFVAELTENPTMGTMLMPNTYKIRIAIGSKNKGKSDGARIITHIHIIQETIYLLTIYDKSEQEDISDNELNDLLDEIPQAE